MILHSWTECTEIRERCPPAESIRRITYSIYRLCMGIGIFSAATLTIDSVTACEAAVQRARQVVFFVCVCVAGANRVMTKLAVRSPSASPGVTCVNGIR